MSNDTELAERTEKHKIKKNDKYYSMIMDFCHKSKNLYNQANYILRDNYIQGNGIVPYNLLDKIVRDNIEYPDYRNMPTAQSAQQTLKMLCSNWKAFSNSLKSWGKNPEKFLGKPKMPKYLKKDSNYVLVLTNQNCKLKGDIIKFPKAFNGFEIKVKFTSRDNYESFQMIRFIPKRTSITVEVVYKISIITPKLRNKRVISIDVGVNNLTTVVNNVNLPSISINGRIPKSMNQFYNKEISKLRSIAMTMNNRHYTKRMERLSEKRNRKINDYMHKASRYIVNYCVENDISGIIIGKNDNWKQKSKLGKVNNQHFVQMPFARLVEMIQYKAEEVGIAVKLTEESYTSGTSFIDGERPVEENFDKSRRVHRGLFMSNNGIAINADVNGAYQIMNKIFKFRYTDNCSVYPRVIKVV